MPSPAVDVSFGFTIVFGTSAFAAQITDITPPAQTREAIGTSYQGTTTAATYMPADLVENGELTFTIHFNPDTAAPIDGAAETVTITWPSGATWAFTGFMTAYTPGAPFNGLMTGEVTVKVSGDITIVAAS